VSLLGREGGDGGAGEGEDAAFIGTPAWRR
jgi:hypothetical protein